MNFEIHPGTASGQGTQAMSTVKLPAEAFVQYRGEIYVSRQWINREAARVPVEQPAERLEIRGPDTVVYHFAGGQRTAKLPTMPFKLLEFVMGQEGQYEHMTNIAATVWGVSCDCTSRIDGTARKVSELLRAFP